ncbi:MAG: AAA-like domain-containing protein [Eubacteriales bacterium]|nr:AAA-like domain-containing protein [Eubacteriales bacterium]
MHKTFNTDGYCDPELHYMVDLSSRLQKIKSMIDHEKYFAINQARQYGKTTTLTALANYLQNDYNVISLDFQGISYADFQSEQNFTAAFSRQLLLASKNLPKDIKEELTFYATGRVQEATLSMLFLTLQKLCQNSSKKVVLIIDEVDSAAKNQIFIDFLAQLRFYYLKRRQIPTFQSVILASVYDVRSVKRKIRADEDHTENSPWNIAAKFRIDMSFSVFEIAGMLQQYEADYHTGMDIPAISNLIYEYTSGYPYLVSGLCKILDEEISETPNYPTKSSAWSIEGFYEAEKTIIKEDNPLYESLLRKLELYPELRSMLYELLFHGKPIPYVATSAYMKDATMFGFIRNENDTAVISNRIFESVLYNHFLAEEFAFSKMYDIGAQEKNQFLVGGHLNIRRILEKFIEAFHELYREEDEAFLENVGRKYFILFLKPILNGIGNYSIEPQTRNHERMDLVIYYRGEQNILELKIWRGNAYNERGEKQLSGYLDYFHMKKGYMLSFNFNKKKEVGMKEIVLGDKLLIEAVV